MNALPAKNHWRGESSSNSIRAVLMAVSIIRTTPNQSNLCL